MSERVLTNRQMKGKELKINSLRFCFELFLELRDAFDLFDRDKSGAISSPELKQVLIALNFNPTENLLRKVMKEMDMDGNGSSRKLLLVLFLV